MIYAFLCLATVFSAMIAVGGLMITILISLIFFREKLRPLQWCGIVICSVVLVLLNL